MADLICYGLEENQISSSVINDLDGIINEYEFCCKQFSRGYVIGELDTFKRAACLLVAINRSTIVPDAILRASIAISVAYKMCETPYC